MRSTRPIAGVCNRSRRVPAGGWNVASTVPAAPATSTTANAMSPTALTMTRDRRALKLYRTCAIGDPLDRVVDEAIYGRRHLRINGFVTIREVRRSAAAG
jgi:hypothetical protein